MKLPRSDKKESWRNSFLLRWNGFIIILGIEASDEDLLRSSFQGDLR
jgi:hypothetical protein